MAGRLTGRKILVTGAAGGMGRRIAEMFVDEGAALALLDRNAPGIEKAAASTGARALACDIASSPEVEIAVRSAIEALGGLDGIVNAAGVYIAKPFAELTPDDWRRMNSVNLEGPFNVIRTALPALKAARQATIVNIASVSAFLPMTGTSVYSATKAGLLMLSKCLALELGPRIRVNTVCPGVVETEMTQHIWGDPANLERVADTITLKRLGKTDDIARAALFLTSEESSFTTGIDMPVDGGFAWH